jgi:hypothetical protein
MIRKTSDGSMIDGEGEIIFFSLERFIRDICESDCCFLCGRDPSMVPFNNEHVLPDWVLDRYGLIGRTINFAQ